jgi:hypothetical protein
VLAALWGGGLSALALFLSVHDKVLSTSRKVAGSNIFEVIGFFDLRNPSSRTTVLGSTRPLTEMSTSSIPGGGGGEHGRRSRLTA